MNSVDTTDKQDIVDLFAERDAAVAEQNPDRLAATQLEDLAGGGRSDYLAVQQLQSEVLAIAYVDDSEQALVAFVRETRWDPTDDEPRLAYLLAYCVHTVLGEGAYCWLIYRIVSGGRSR